MSEILKGEALVAKLHADHLGSIKFMNVIADRLEPLYADWQASHSWDEVEVGEYIKIPAVWRAFDGTYSDPDYTHLQKAAENLTQYVNACGDKGALFDAAVVLGLDMALTAGARSELYIKPKESFGLDPHEVYRSESAFLGTVAVLSEYDQNGHIDPYLGELFVTNIGEGDEMGYEHFHQSRMQVARLSKQLFCSELEIVALEYPDEIPKLSRAIMDQLCPTYERPEVDPLINMVVEGVMSVGQATNALVQAGVEGQVSVVEDMRDVLAARLPLLYARLLTNGSIGPNQMAGLAEPNLLTRTGKGLQLKPNFRQRLLHERSKLKQDNAELAGEMLEFMQLPEAQVVNRFEGCPATRLIKLSSRMLLDAMQPETA